MSVVVICRFSMEALTSRQITLLLFSRPAGLTTEFPMWWPHVSQPPGLCFDKINQTQLASMTPARAYVYMYIPQTSLASGVLTYFL